jgi:hypothetical protein
MKLGMYIMAPAIISTAYFINPSHQSVSVCISLLSLLGKGSVNCILPFVATQRLSKNVTVLNNAHATIKELLDASIKVQLLRLLLSLVSDIQVYIVTWLWLQTRFGLVTGFIEHLQKVITNNYDSLTELHTLKITVTTAHIKSSQSSLAVVWLRLQRRTFPYMWVPKLSQASANSFSLLKKGWGGGLKRVI